MQRWSPLSQHPNLLVLRGHFVSKDIEQVPSMFFLHEYLPLATTLDAFHVQPVAGRCVLQDNYI